MASRLRRRWLYILPAVFITYSLAYLDRFNYGFGAAAGLAATLNISKDRAALLGALFLPGVSPLPGSYSSCARKRNVRSNISLESGRPPQRRTLPAVAPHAPGPAEVLPVTPQMLLTRPSGDLLGMSQNASMGWNPACLLDPEGRLGTDSFLAGWRPHWSRWQKVGQLMSQRRPGNDALRPGRVSPGRCITGQYMLFE
jgi:hypothetical protein